MSREEISKLDWKWRKKAVDFDMILKAWQKAGKITIGEEIQLKQALSPYIAAYTEYELVVNDPIYKKGLEEKRKHCEHDDTEESNCTKCGYPYGDY